jgi:hypothetical protein
MIPLADISRLPSRFPVVTAQDEQVREDVDRVR